MVLFGVLINLTEVLVNPHKHFTRKCLAVYLKRILMNLVDVCTDLVKIIPALGDSILGLVRVYTNWSEVYINLTKGCVELV